MKLFLAVLLLLPLVSCSSPGHGKGGAGPDRSTHINGHDPEGEVARPVPSAALEKGPTKVVMAQLESYNARDIGSFVDHFAENAKVQYFPDGKSLAEGQDEIREVYGKVFEDSPDLHCRVLSTVKQDDWVIIHEQITGFPEHPVYHFIALYRVENDLITELWLIPEESEQ